MTSRLILASGSAVRARLLRDAGVPFEVMSSGVDEDAIKAAMTGEAARVIAHRLAVEKAMAVSADYADAHVIGADQILECDGRLFDKPADLGQAKGHLQVLRGRTHRLITVTVVVRGHDILWSHTEVPHLTMRDLRDTFITRYLARVGENALHSVGAYQLEGQGAQLFEHIDGDFFSILGLPLLPLLAFLRSQTVIEA